MKPTHSVCGLVSLWLWARGNKFSLCSRQLGNVRALDQVQWNLPGKLIIYMQHECDNPWTAVVPTLKLKHACKRQTDTKHKYSCVSSCWDIFILLCKSDGILIKCGRWFKLYLAICFMKTKWPLKGDKSCDHVLLVWLPDKLKIKK